MAVYRGAFTTVWCSQQMRGTPHRFDPPAPYKSPKPLNPAFSRCGNKKIQYFSTRNIIDQYNSATAL